MARVARAYGSPFWDVLDAAWVDVLAADMALDEVERVDRFVAESDALRFAQYVGLGMGAPRELAALGQALEREAKRQRQDIEPEEAQRLMRQADKALRIARRQRKQMMH